jgi:hypothetical protein
MVPLTKGKNKESQGTEILLSKIIQTEILAAIKNI